MFALTATLIAMPSSGARPSTDLSAVDRVVWTELTAAHVPGATLVTVNRDELVRVKSFGVAAQDGRPVTPTTPFVPGSTSKSFTALAVMQLVEEGKITLATPAAKYVPELLALPPQQRSGITIARLLNHTSGLQAADY